MTKERLQQLRKVAWLKYGKLPAPEAKEALDAIEELQSKLDSIHKAREVLPWKGREIWVDGKSVGIEGTMGPSGELGVDDSKLDNVKDGWTGIQG